MKTTDNNPAYENILSRTSERRYIEGKSVPLVLTQAMLHAAMSAPTAVNKQPWEFIVVDDPELLHQLGADLPYAKMTARAPLALVVCGNKERFLPGDDSSLWVQDLSAASENILLAANALGLGAVWTSVYPHADRQATVSRILRLPENIIPFNVIPMGYPAEPHAPINKWNPSRVHINGF